LPLLGRNGKLETEECAEWLRGCQSHGWLPPLLGLRLTKCTVSEIRQRIPAVETLDVGEMV
jgi:hypothetical protein